ncbi:hypothetical protein EJV46_05335 [Roseococcus sp. SYP-B2431]|uniref:hypothetical protein n=1 Tax=Roseococcus sp. SYP-B2431 TaxID=2496640 RepID=UPI00103ABAD2|nr:hypothetical protein [Roseococcus sp. SYP-B2431]TCI00079.1 hypothetical protein EJV46_05335 [Roseococcus sp. SYP-B2431]
MVARWILALCVLLGPLPAPAQEDPGAALLAAIEARDPAAVAAAFAVGARPDRPARLPPAFAMTDALAATPDEATRATLQAFAEAARAAGFAPEAQIAGPMGHGGGSLSTRLAALPGEEALFLRVAGLTAPERRCTLLGQLVFGRDGANFPAAAALLPLIPPERAAEPACSLPFTMLAHPSRRPPPALVEAMLAAGLRPYPDALAELVRQLPPGVEGDGAFRRLAALDLGAVATDSRNGARRRMPVLAQLGEDVLAERAARVEPLLGRWAELVEAAPAAVLCATLPRQAVRGWLSIEGETSWMEALRGTTRSLLLRCPAEAFDEALAEAAGDRLWTRLVERRERPTLRLMLAAGLRPADLAGFAGSLACAAEARLLQALVETGAPEGARLLPHYMGCLGGVEARREGDLDTLALILAHESAAGPVAGDSPVAVAEAIDRPDIVEALADHGAVRSRLMAERQAFWRHRRLAALAGTQGPTLPWEPEAERVPAAPELMRLAPGLGAWLIHGECGNVNCGYAIAVREGRGYRLVLEDAGYGFRLERAIGGRARDVTIQARTNAAIHNVTTWRYDGRVYRRIRCRETVTEEEEGGATRQRVREGACAD